MSSRKLDVDAVLNGSGANGNGEVREKPYRLDDICEAYLADQAQKQDTTLVAEKVHIRHLKRILRARTHMEEITLDTLRQYKRRRKREKRNGNFTSDIRKHDWEDARSNGVLGPHGQT